jgi:hypothetical protein
MGDSMFVKLLTSSGEKDAAPTIFGDNEPLKDDKLSSWRNGPISPLKSFNFKVMVLPLEEIT